MSDINQDYDDIMLYQDIDDYSDHLDCPHCPHPCTICGSSCFDDKCFYCFPERCIPCQICDEGCWDGECSCYEDEHGDEDDEIVIESN